MPFSVYFDSPSNYQNKFDFYNVGASPLLLEKLINILNNSTDKIEVIQLGLYLFNNEILNQKLIALANAGIKIDVITIPLEGYDANNAKEIINIKTRKVDTVATKHSLARNIFIQHYYKKIPNYTLYFFPHMYLRSGKMKNFSRGNFPYSFHLKSFLIKYKNEIGIVGISSSNFAVRDLVKEENLLIIENEIEYFNPVYNFFKALIENSIPIYDFDFKEDYTKYEIKIIGQPVSNYTNFIAPFYFDSAFKAEEKILELIDSATSTIRIAAQHICPIGYQFDGNFHSGFDNEEIFKEGLLKTIIEKAANGVKVEFISQTFASNENNVGKKFREPVNKTSFIEFYDAIKNAPNISYTINENLHSKYMIVDNKVFVSSFNYTPTQFIYLDKVDIKTFKNNPGKSYEGIYCETGQYCIIDNEALAKQYEGNFNSLLLKKDTVIVKKFS